MTDGSRPADQGPLLVVPELEPLHGLPVLWRQQTQQKLPLEIFRSPNGDVDSPAQRETRQFVGHRPRCGRRSAASVGEATALQTSVTTHKVQVEPWNVLSKLQTAF